MKLGSVPSEDFFLSLSLSPLLSLPSVSLSTSLSLSRNPQRDLRTYMHGCRNLVPLMVAGAKLFLTLFTVFYPLLPALPLTPTPGTRGGGWPIQTFGGRRRGWDRNLRLFCKLCPLDVTTSEKDAVAQELRKLAVCYLPFWGHLQGSKKFCLRGTSLVWFSPVCSNVQFHFFFFSISFSISYHRSHFEKPCLSHNSSHPHLLAQHY